MAAVWIILGLVAVLLLVIFVYIKSAEFNKYTFVSGTWEGYGKYSYVMVKGDTTKYTYTIGKNNQVILGEPIDRELADIFEAWDELERYASEHGPIGSHEITDKEIDLLKRVGFKVEEDE